MSSESINGLALLPALGPGTYSVGFYARSTWQKELRIPGAAKLGTAGSARSLQVGQTGWIDQMRSKSSLVATWQRMVCQNCPCSRKIRKETQAINAATGSVAAANPGR